MFEIQKIYTVFIFFPLDTFNIIMFNICRLIYF